MQGYGFSETLSVGNIINGIKGRYINMNIQFQESLVDNMNIGHSFSENINITTAVNGSHTEDPIIPPPQYTWRYNGSSTEMFCFAVGYNPIGTQCSVPNSVEVVSGEDIGRPSGCYEIICR